MVLPEAIIMLAALGRLVATATGLEIIQHLAEHRRRMEGMVRAVAVGMQQPVEQAGRD
jgi:precorrin-6B methylase 2